MTKKVSDLLGVGLILISLFIIIESFKITTFYKYIGILGGIIIILVEIVYLFEVWAK